MRYTILFILIFTMSLTWAVSDEMGDSALAGTSRYEASFEPSFCMDGEIMQQLLQGFGSTILVDEVSGRVLNCEARIVREEIVGSTGVIDLELNCECSDPDGGGIPPDHLQGQWRVAIDF